MNRIMIHLSKYLFKHLLCFFNVKEKCSYSGKKILKPTKSKKCSWFSCELLWADVENSLQQATLLKDIHLLVPQNLNLCSFPICSSMLCLRVFPEMEGKEHDKGMSCPCNMLIIGNEYFNATYRSKTN